MSTNTTQLLAEIPLFSTMDDEERIKADLDYQVNVKTELELSTMAEHIRDIEQKLQHIHYDVLEASGGKEGA